MTMKNMSDNVMSSLGLQPMTRSTRGGAKTQVDPSAAIAKVRDSKKNVKAKAYKAALLDLLYLQAVTGQIPGMGPNDTSMANTMPDAMATQGLMSAAPPPAPMGGMPPSSMAGGMPPGQHMMAGGYPMMGMG